MEITLSMLEDKNMLPECIKFFSKHFPEEGGLYQDVLAKCAKEGHDKYAYWLLKIFGPTDDVLEVEGSLKADFIFFPGSLKIGGALTVKGCVQVGGSIDVDEDLFVGDDINAELSIEVGRSIYVGNGIESGHGIKSGLGIDAGHDIKSGFGIESGDYIKAGESYGIYAGLVLSLSDHALHAQVIAKTKPDNLISGVFIERSH